MENNNHSGRTHNYFQAYLGAYFDGELDLVRNLEIENHLKECELCSTDYKNQMALRKAMRANASYFKSSPTLRTSVLSSIRKTEKTDAKPSKQSWQWLGLAASFAVLAIVAFAIVLLLRQPPDNHQLAHEIVSEHIRSLMRPSEIVQVESNDQHLIKPWFNGKIDFSPPVKNIDDQGFPMTGGRLDYIDNRTVAALVYRRQLHYINLFIWPSSDKTENIMSQNGYNIVHWTKDGMTFWAVSDLNAAELKQFAQLFKQ